MENMNTESLADEAVTVKALAALAQPQRLRAFRGLVVAGPQGLTPGAMAEQLGITPSALSFHLKELANAGLVSSEPRGRNLIYRANFDADERPARLPDAALLRGAGLRAHRIRELRRLLTRRAGTTP